MKIRNELRIVTEELKIARLALMEAEIKRAVCRRRYITAESELTAARVVLMARGDAGSNDIARRAYAERETTDEREALALQRELLDEAEIGVIEATARLRIVEDRRRWLESLVTIEVNDLVDEIREQYGDNPVAVMSGGDDEPPF